jgi:putative peptidoglycan lipid II flippase
MSGGGGLYRSAHSAGGAPDSRPVEPPGDRAVVEPPFTDQAIVEPPGTGPGPVEGAPGPLAGTSGPIETGGRDDGPTDEPGAAGNSAVMAIGSLVSRGTGFLRTAVMAAALGGGLVGNAYGTAQFFPGMIYELLLGGILSSVLVPVLVRRRKSDPDGGQAYAQRLLTLTALVLGVATVLAVIAAPLLTLLTDGDPSDDFRELVTAWSRLMLPIMFFSGVSALLGAVLNTRGHFAAPMWAPILNNVVVMATAGVYIAIFGASRIPVGEMSTDRIVLIGGGTLLGVAVQLAGLWPALRRVGFRFRLRFDFRALGLRELGRLGSWMFCYVAVSQVGVLVTLDLLNRAGAKDQAAGVAIYNNIYLLLMMAHGIVAVSIITALMPRMSAAAADGRYADVAADLSRGTRMSTALLAPISVVYAVTALPLVVTLFRRGAFSQVDAERAAPVLVVAAIALVPFAISQLFTFAYYAMTDTKTPALINIPVVVLRVAVQVGLFLAFTEAFAASGLMIGNAISYVVAAVLSAWLLRSRVGRIGMRGISTTFAKVAAASLGAGLVGFLVIRLLPGDAEPSHWEALLQVVLGGLVIGVTYLGLAMLLKIREINEVLGLVRRKLGR